MGSVYFAQNSQSAKRLEPAAETKLPMRLSRLEESCHDASLLRFQLQLGLGQGVADACEPDGAAHVVIGEVRTGLFPLGNVVAPARIELFGRLINQLIGAHSGDIPLELRTLWHCQLSLLDGQHGALPRAGIRSDP